MVKGMKELGKVISGSIDKGVKIILEDTEDIERYPIGSLVSISGTTHNYLGIITDAGISTFEGNAYAVVNPRTSSTIKNVLLKVYKDKMRIQWIEIALIAQRSSSAVSLADTMPSFASVLIGLEDKDIAEFFGVENRIDMWNIGIPKTPKEIFVSIPINVRKLVNLSFGIFGKSGTGKTFLGNMLAGYMILFNLIANDEKPLRLLIFDMHTEYALELKDNMGNPIADGVAKIFADFFLRYSPDEEIVKKRGLRFLRLNLKSIDIDDIRMIAPLFGLTETFLHYLSEFKSIISNKFRLGDYWFLFLLLSDDVIERLKEKEAGGELLEKVNNLIKDKTGFASITILRRQLEEALKKELGAGAFASFKSQSAKLKRILSYPFTIDEDPIEEIVNNLIRRDGASVTISFGKYEKETALYMLIANLIAKRLRDKINEKTRAGEEPETKIVIFLEEAHNFLGKKTYRFSPFGDIAREMRKKGVILCVIDQRPSELDPDVISMLWTSFIFSLTERSDIETALIGAPRAHLFRKIVPLLRNREVLIFGEAVRFPIIVKIRDYKEAYELFRAKRMELMSEMRRREEGFREAGLL